MEQQTNMDQMQPQTPPVTPMPVTTQLKPRNKRMFFMIIVLLLIGIVVAGYIVLNNSKKDQDAPNEVENNISEDDEQEDTADGEEEVEEVELSETQSFKLSPYPQGFPLLKFDIDTNSSAETSFDLIPVLDTAPPGVAIPEQKADVYREFIIETSKSSLRFYMASHQDNYPQELVKVATFKNSDMQGQIMNDELNVVQQQSNKNVYLIANDSFEGEYAVLTFAAGDQQYNYDISCTEKAEGGLEECIKSLETLKVEYFATYEGASSGSNYDQDQNSVDNTFEVLGLGITPTEPEWSLNAAEESNGKFKLVSMFANCGEISFTRASLEGMTLSQKAESILGPSEANLKDKFHVGEFETITYGSNGIGEVYNIFFKVDNNYFHILYSQFVPEGGNAEAQAKYQECSKEYTQTEFGLLLNSIEEI